MAVKIRLKRMGSKKRPFYRIVASDSRSPRDGRFIETLGYYNPIVEPPEIKVHEDRVFRWMRHGAIPTGNAASLLRRTGTMKKWALLRQGVPESELEARYEALRQKETPPMSADERARREAEKQAAAKTEADAQAVESAKAADEARADAGDDPADAAGDETPAGQS